MTLYCGRLDLVIPIRFSSSSFYFRVHYRKILYKHTDESLGDCSFLNTCFHMDTCKYVHYEMDEIPRTELDQTNMTLAQKYRVQEDTMLWPAQWVQCDLRFFDMSVLGKFTVIMAGGRNEAVLEICI